MAALSDYTSGRISLANGSTTVTGTGTLFNVAKFREGDTLQIQNLTAVIASVNSDTSLRLTAPWTGTTLTNAVYRARYLPDGARVTAQATTLIELLGNGNLQSIAGLTGAADKGLMFTGAGTAGLFDLTTLARTFLSRSTGAGMYGDLGEIPNAQLPGRLRPVSPNIGDANTANENGFFSSDGSSTNVPSSSPAVILNIRYSATGGYQRWVSVTGDEVYERRQSGGNWPTWKRVDIVATRTASSAVITLPTSAGNLIVQLATTTASTDGGGFGDFALATTYPTAQITCVMNTGNYSASSSVIGPRTGAADLTTSRVFFRSGALSSLIRINYISIGY